MIRPFSAASARVEIRPLRPAPDPLAVLVGLCAAQAAGADLEPFLIGSERALHGEAAAPFTLIGWSPAARCLPGSADGRTEADFPWSPDAAGLIRSLAAFIEGTTGPSATGQGATGPGPAAGALSLADLFRGGAVVGWIGHELPATRLVRHEQLLLVDGRSGDAWVIAAPEGGREAMGRLSGAATLGAALLAEQRRRTPGSRPPAIDPGDVVRQSYEARVRTVQGQIADGDVYQVNLSHPLSLRLRRPDPVGAALAFVDLVHANPVPFPAFLGIDDTVLVVLSPERYLARRGALLESRPIKGTRPRGADPGADAELRRALAASEKDRAENVMIVDLVRNDLGRIAVTGGVETVALAEVESFASVHHLVSTVRGRLRPEVGVADILTALHPAGSMTGAPKESAVRSLAALEAAPRGAYAGGVGWFAAGGDFDLAMVIRSLVLRGGEAVLRVGGGIVADSDPAAEYQETLDKAASLVRALAAGGHLGPA